MSKFVPRLTIPEKGNPYYNTKDAGGYSTAIKGKPTEDGLNVLHNCVGWAFGRYNEIIGEKACNYLQPCNAELFIHYMNDGKKKGLTSGMTPKLGAVAVWQAGATQNGSDGAGHVAIVEQINADGSIVTSESGYNASKAFWTQKRTNSNGRWGQNSNYKFLGFIYNPAVPDETPVTPTKNDFEVNEIVFFGGTKEFNSSTDKASQIASPCLAKITKIADGKPHPYHCRHCNAKGSFVSGGVYGWVDAADVYKLSDYKAALDVIAGKYGNGAKRKAGLTNAGYNYTIVQKIVNIIRK